MEINRVQGDHFRGGKEGVKVNLFHWAGDTIRTTGGADEPSVTGQGVVDVLAFANGTCFVVVGIFGVAGLDRSEKHK